MSVTCKGQVVWYESQRTGRHYRIDMSDHLWVQDGERIVCTECELDLEDFKKGVPHDN